jgi:YgiT-type zinc finger domain-containing protein
MLIPLICKQCGGRLEVEDAKVSISGESFIVLPDQKFECPHCGMKYFSDNASRPVYANNGGVAVGNISIGGEIKGNIVIGNGTVSAKPSSSVKKPTKKWWELWK